MCAVAPFRMVFGGCFLSVEMKLLNVFCASKLKPYAKDAFYDFNGIRLPKFPEHDYHKTAMLYLSVWDVLFAYLFNNDKYNKEFVAKSDRVTQEGVYCYQDGQVDLTIKPGDVVLDLGSCFGEFAAYAAHKGATCYAFEPFAQNRDVLQKTVELNEDAPGKIIIVPLGVDSQSAVKSIAANSFVTGASISSESVSKEQVSDGADDTIETVSIDAWAAQEGIRINFIKADIEGFERRMLQGATRVLKEQQPVLSLCTYHLPDDPEVIQDLILKANPKYRVIQRRMKLLAYIPQ